MKRRRDDEEQEQTTPRKTRRKDVEDEPGSEVAVNETPSKSLKQTPSKSALSKLNGTTDGIATPKSHRKVLFATPTKAVEEDGTPNGTPTLVRNADRSARRKSARRIIERNLAGEETDEDVEDEDVLAQQIYGDSEEEGDQEAPIGIAVPEDGLLPEPETPSKRKRGRPKGSKNREVTPPTDLPLHEQYFWQNRAGGMKTSNNTLPSHLLLNHDEYFEQTQAYIDPHEAEKDFLVELHSRSFDQWAFELKNGFNICLYGYGSKRQLTQRFVEHVYEFRSSDKEKDKPKIAVINAYTPGLTIRDFLQALSSAIIPTAYKLPAYHLSNTAASLLNILTSDPPSHPITILVNSLDAPTSPFRRQANLSILASLASSPYINLIATADTPTFPLLFDLSLRTQFNWLFHDCTTFTTFSGVEIDVVETCNELLGRGGRRIGGRDGVAYVLKSLPENAKGVFRILLAEQLASADDDGAFNPEEDDEDFPTANGDLTKKPMPGGEGVEYRILYHKALEELLCTNEMSFRTLLKEFHDHRMVESKRDIAGTERLVIPFRREDLEGLLEELA